jgi:L-alanine-DL-glutamate epimerase-like enolase superfamily enzyme
MGLDPHEIGLEGSPLRLVVTRRILRLKAPLRTSYGTVRERELLTVALVGKEGIAGYGDVAPLEPYDGVSVRRVAHALERYRLAVEALPVADGARVRRACRDADDLPAALSAIDLALWDLAGRREGKSVCTLLADAPAASVAVNATLSAQDRTGAAEQAAHAVAQGFACLKLKVGTGDDVARVAAVRAAAGPQAALRLDANGAWDAEQAVRAIHALEPAGLELVEEPTHGVQAMRAVRERVAARVSIDETSGMAGALGAGVADAVCLKIARCGGIAGLLAAATLAGAAGMDVYVASALDGPLAVAGALHAAAALASRGPLPPCGLATLGMFEGMEQVLAPTEGRIAVPQAAGLGVEPASA